MRKWYLGLALALALAPAAASAQQPMHAHRMGTRMGTGMGMRMGTLSNPADMVLRHQAHLNLTPSQLKKLGKIRDEYQHDNAKALERVQKERAEIVRKYGRGPYTAEQQEKIRNDRAEIRDDYAKLAKARREAMDDIREVLTADQESRLMSYLRAERQQARQRASR